MKPRKTAFYNSVVINKYCAGKTLDKIVEETNLSKGTVYNRIKHWKDRLANAGIEEIREFAIILNKSGITIQECAQGFRIVQILRKFGINDEFEERDDSEPKRDLLEEIMKESIDFDNDKNDHALAHPDLELVKKRNKDAAVNNEVYFFIEDIYNKCKKYSIKPYDIIGWIKDLHDFFPTLDCEFPSSPNKDTVPSHSTDSEDKSEALIFLSEAIDREYDGDTLKDYRSKGETSTKQINESGVSFNIPYVSQVSYYINQIKQELKERAQYRESLNTEISILENKKSNLENNIKEATNKKNNILSHLKWYDFLRKELSEKYSMNLDEEIIFFSSIIKDFETFGYNILDILKEYKQIQSLRKERDHIQNDIDLNIPLQQSLLQQVNLLNSQLDMSRQTMKIYWELDAMEFDLKRLKRLHYTIIEVSRANNLPIVDAGTKFFNDIEEHYDNKLGFEVKIKELMTILDILREEITPIRSNLQIQNLMTLSLSYLMRNGVTAEDIINLSKLIVSLQNSNFLSNALSQGGNAGNGIGINITENKSKNDTWELVINKLIGMQNIDSEIGEPINCYDELDLTLFYRNLLKDDENEEILQLEE